MGDGRQRRKYFLHVPGLDLTVLGMGLVALVVIAWGLRDTVNAYTGVSAQIQLQDCHQEPGEAFMPQTANCAADWQRPDGTRQTVTVEHIPLERTKPAGQTISARVHGDRAYPGSGWDFTSLLVGAFLVGCTLYMFVRNRRNDRLINRKRR
jgi:hypothetical protein